MRRYFTDLAKNNDFIEQEQYNYMYYLKDIIKDLDIDDLEDLVIESFNEWLDNKYFQKIEDEMELED